MEQRQSYRMYIWAPSAEKAIRQRTNKMIILGDQHEHEPNPPIDFDEYLGMWQAIHPSFHVLLEKQLRLGVQNFYALSYAVTFTGMEKQDEVDFLDSFRESGLIVAWESSNQPLSFHWVIDFVPPLALIPNLSSELRFVQKQYYHLSMPRPSKALSLRGMIEETGEFFWSDDQLRQNEVLLIFTLAPAQHLLGWVHTTAHRTHAEIVAMFRLACPSERHIVVERTNGLGITVIPRP